MPGNLPPHIYPQFIQRANSGLRLNPAEKALASAPPAEMWAEWGVSVLSGDEYVGYLEAIDRPTSITPFFAGEIAVNGTTYLDYRAGTLAERVRAMYDSKNTSEQNRFTKFSDAIADFAFTVDALLGPRNKPWHQFYTSEPQTGLGPHKRYPGRVSVAFTDSAEVFPVEGPVDYVANFGPGISGGMFVNNLSGNAKEVMLVSGGMGAQFVNRWNSNVVKSMAASIVKHRRDGTLRQHCPPGVNPDDMQVPRTHSFTRGIAASVRMLPKKLDVAVMSAVHQAGTEECIAGIDGVSETLREGGLLIIKAPDISLGDEAGMDIVGAHAAQLLGTAIMTGECGQLRQLIDPSLPEHRPASFAIYQK